MMWVCLEKMHLHISWIFMAYDSLPPFCPFFDRSWLEKLGCMPEPCSQEYHAGVQACNSGTCVSKKNKAIIKEIQSWHFDTVLVTVSQTCGLPWIERQNSWDCLLLGCFMDVHPQTMHGKWCLWYLIQQSPTEELMTYPPSEVEQTPKPSGSQFKSHAKSLPAEHQWSMEH